MSKSILLQPGAKPFPSYLDFSGGPVVKTPPVSAGDMGSTPDPERSRMLKSHVGPCTTTVKPVL